MLVTIKAEGKRLDLFPACAMGGNIAFDQLGVGDFIHFYLSGVHELVTRKCIAPQVLNLRADLYLQKFLDGLLMKGQVVLNGVPNLGEVDADVSRDDAFADAGHVVPLQFGMFILKFD